MSTPGIISSTGRGQVTAPQVPVVLTYDAHVEAFKRRAREGADSPWPLGSKTDFSMLRGELAFQYNEQTDMARPHNPSYNVVKAFTAFNGLLCPANISFAGVVDREYIADRNGTDTAVTLRRCGTHTIINTGKGHIAQG